MTENIIKKEENGNIFYQIKTDNGWKYHNINDLPAIIYKIGTIYWCKYGKTHRENGPAIIRGEYYYEGLEKEEYYLNDKRIFIPKDIKNDKEKIKEYLQLQMNF